jgi:hypothetical protein
MRTLKLILGIGGLLVAPLSAILATGLIYAGGLLITRRNLPISRSARIRLLLYFSGIGILAAVGLPNFIKARSTSAANACINNLRQIDAAANQFALEKNLKTGDKINFPDDLTPYIKLNSQGKIPPCPQGGTYSIKRVGDTPTCSLGTVDPAHALP